MANDNNNNPNNDFTSSRGKGSSKPDVANNAENDDSLETEGGKDKAKKNERGSHQEGNYDKQSDKSTMRPTSMDM